MQLFQARQTCGEGASYLIHGVIRLPERQIDDRLLPVFVLIRVEKDEIDGGRKPEALHRRF
jgi:hypothetical protein